MKRGSGGDRKSNQKSQRAKLDSEYAQAKKGAGISDSQAVRWQKLAELPHVKPARPGPQVAGISISPWLLFSYCATPNHAANSATELAARRPGTTSVVAKPIGT